MQLPVFFGLGCEDLMRQSADGKGGGVVGEPCSFTCHLMSPQLTPHIGAEAPTVPLLPVFLQRDKAGLAEVRGAEVRGGALLL